MASLTVELPADLCDAVRRRFVRDSETLEDFLAHVLRELLDDGWEIQAREEKFLEDRLRSLGYLSEG